LSLMVMGLLACLYLLPWKCPELLPASDCP
jgi:hypothetical protein